MEKKHSIDELIDHIEDVELTTVHGRITEIVGTLMRAVVPQVKMGEICLVKREGAPLIAEVVGFTQGEVFLSPVGEMKGIGPSSEVIPLRMPLHIKVGNGLLGRVLNGVGEPLDSREKGPLKDVPVTFPVITSPPTPLHRQLISEPISTGVRCIDGILPCA